MEFDGSLREGELHMDSVEMEMCGQPDTRKAAIRFENALTNSHTVENCAIHSSPSWGINGFRSKNLWFDNNIIWNSI
jgi:hypothetical protein